MGPRLLIINHAYVHLLINVPKDSYLIFLQDIVQEGEFGGPNIFKLTMQGYDSIFFPSNAALGVSLTLSQSANFPFLHQQWSSFTFEMFVLITLWESKYLGLWDQKKGGP